MMNAESVFEGEEEMASRTHPVVPALESGGRLTESARALGDRGGTTLEDVGAIMNLTRERIRQVEVKGLAKLEALSDMTALRDYVDEGPVGKRRLPMLKSADAEAVKEEAEEETDEFDVDEFA